MEELVLVLGSVAGACTAVAMDKIPRRRNNKQIIGTSSTIKSQIQSLKIEKEILTKTISRLYQQESELSKVNRDKLLLRYQHQLGIVITRIEKLETARSWTTWRWIDNINGSKTITFRSKTKRNFFQDCNYYHFSTPNKTTRIN